MAMKMVRAVETSAARSSVLHETSQRPGIAAKSKVDELKSECRRCSFGESHTVCSGAMRWGSEVHVFGAPVQGRSLRRAYTARRATMTPPRPTPRALRARISRQMIRLPLGTASNKINSRCHNPKMRAFSLVSSSASPRTPGSRAPGPAAPPPAQRPRAAHPCPRPSWRSTRSSTRRPCRWRLRCPPTGSRSSPDAARPGSWTRASFFSPTRCSSGLKSCPRLVKPRAFACTHHWMIVSIETLLRASKHRKTAFQGMYPSRSTVMKSGAPEVS